MINNLVKGMTVILRATDTGFGIIFNPALRALKYMLTLTESV